LNLTVEQRDLLKAIVAQYDSGRKGEFIFSTTMDASMLIYASTGAGQAGGTIPIDADESDFKQLTLEGLLTLVQRENNLVGKPTEFGIQAVHAGRVDAEVSKAVVRALNRETGRVFIGHGQSPAWKDLREFLEKRLDLLTDEFNREPAAGYSTQEILDRMLNDACFAFLVMTGEDAVADGTTRARENVTHEIGLFQGRLGFRRAIILLEEGCTEFSNIHGLTVIKFPKAKIMTVSEEIRRVLEREGLVK
jgi:predicted nucleotide-binding protein